LVTLPTLSDPNRIALFLDFDGTLAAITDVPEEVRIDPATRGALVELDKQLNGAVAIITGREIETIDHFLAPLRLSIAGVHGLTRRDASGRIYAPLVAAGFGDAIEIVAESLVKNNPGLLLERKYGAIALHYRARPDLESLCLATMEKAATGARNIELKRGKMVVEARAIGGNKGSAVADYMSEQPFAGRTAIFAGDDITDEDAFDLVNARGGISIKIGPGETRATYQTANIVEFLAWLRQLPMLFGGRQDIA
jgi:trehalose 6-phosphate phosphatase